MIAVGNDDALQSGSTGSSNNTYTVTDTIPYNMTFLGVHTVLHNVAIANSNDMVPEHYLSALITGSNNKGGPVSGHLFQPHENGGSGIGDGYVTYDMVTVPGTTAAVPAGGSYTWTRNGQNLTFTVTQPKGHVTYIFYSCSVWGGGGEISNTASITGSSTGTLYNWDNMVTTPTVICT